MKFLKPPAWSVRALLPDFASTPTTATEGTVPRATIAHLHRLSALPMGANDEADLRDHLHFVRALAAGGDGGGKGEVKWNAMQLATRKEG
ncbi:unnamed protein product, partial [Tuber aestivum]